ncbi:MAG: Asp-tRNA(Asn)/Glu-tRNA(Gln) amidotransferase subunit GatA [Syntrophomonadaceae bacterium]|nr:Asp-tRNA(Asn)/Glu-tRNA(Gln) amidotransferase subunit GatA [Syntrophomonadaceae bacterium]
MELYELTLHELQDKLQKKETSSEEITRSVFSRINQVEDKVKSFITVIDKETVLKKARESDESGKFTGVTGIPYGLKDLFCTRGVLTTCASNMLANYIPTHSSTAVSKLEEQKGIMVGKLNMDEFAMGSSTETSAFFPTRNPWDLDRMPGGSSGGSAAAVRADEVIFSLGSDTGGSIRQPASFCGVVGLKPTYGRVSRSGVVAFASSLDQVGVFSKDVEDCAIVLKTISGYDPLDSTSVNIEVPDYTTYLDGDIKGMKIGYPREYFEQGVTEDIKQAVFKALKKFEELGAIVEEVSLPHSEYALPAYYLIAPAEASTNMAKFDGVRFGYRNTSADNVIDMFCNSRSDSFGDEVKRRIMLGTYALSSGYYDAYYLKALKVRRLIANDFDKVFKDFDIIISPTTPNTAFKIGQQDDPLALYMNDILTVPVNMAGLPGMSIPCGFSNGLPIGMQLIGKPFAEGSILKAAYAFEQNTDYHKVKPDLGVK